MSVSPEFANSGNQEQKQDSKPSFLEQMESGVRAASSDEERQKVDLLNALTRFENLRSASPRFAAFIDDLDHDYITPEVVASNVEKWNELLSKEPALSATGYRQTFSVRLSNGVSLFVEYFAGGGINISPLEENQRVHGAYTNYIPPTVGSSEALEAQLGASAPGVDNANATLEDATGYKQKRADGWDVEKFISPEQVKLRRDQLDKFDLRLEQLHDKAHTSPLFEPAVEHASIYFMPHGTSEERAARLQKYEEFRARYAKWQKQLSLMYTHLVKAIRESPGMPLDEVYDLVMAEGEARDISPYVLIKFMEGARGYEARHFVVRTLREKFQDDKLLFRQLFNQEPVGEVEVIERPMSLYIRCHSLSDYALAYAYGDAGQIDQARAAMSGGAHLQGFYLDTIMIENVPDTEAAPDDEAASAAILLHEEQHAINKLLIGEIAPRFVTLRNDTGEQMLESVTDFCRADRESIESRAKDEILAYLAGAGRSADFIKYVMKTEWKDFGLYDYVSQWEKLPEIRSLLTSAIPLEYRYKAEGIMRAEFGTEYHRNIDEAIDSVKRLATFGYSKQFMIGLLAGVPLRSWPAAVRRLGQGRMADDAVIDPFANPDQMTWVQPYKRYIKERSMMGKIVKGVRRIKHFSEPKQPVWTGTKGSADLMAP